MEQFCVYLTVYKGNKLPPFYIGSTSIKKILKGYKGSVSSKRYKSIWRQEVTNNPQLFKVNVIKTFLTRDDAYNHEKKLQILLRVIYNPLYINLSISRILPTGYGRLNPFYGKKHKQSSKKAMVANRRDYIGEDNPFYGKNHSTETKQRIGKKSARQKHTQAKKKYWSETRRGPRNGFYQKTHSEETKQRWRETRHLARWYNNGAQAILRMEHPGEGWVRGRLPLKNKA